MRMVSKYHQAAGFYFSLTAHAPLGREITNTSQSLQLREKVFGENTHIARVLPTDNLVFSRKLLIIVAHIASTPPIKSVALLWCGKESPKEALKTTVLSSYLATVGSDRSFARKFRKIPHFICVTLTKVIYHRPKENTLTMILGFWIEWQCWTDRVLQRKIHEQEEKY